jgi:hypothetical protein
MQMGEMADLIDEHRAAVTSCFWPPVSPGTEHEVVDDQLPTAFE